MSQQRPQTSQESVPQLRDHSLQPIKQFDVEEMWNISKRVTSAWGIPGYDAPRVYTDPLRQMKEREYLKQKKGLKDNRYQTKKGNFMDITLKVAKQIPGPDAYNTVKPWPEAKNKDAKQPKDIPKNKNTFLDQIYFDAKKRAIPGPGTYNLRKTDKEIEEQQKQQSTKKIFGSERTNFLCEVEFLSNVVPGPGNYNPHKFLDKINPQRKEDNPKDTIKLHLQQEKEKMKKAVSKNGPGSYNPEPCMYQTFTKLGTQYTKLKEEKKQEKFFGTAERFSNPLKTKSKAFILVPGPGQYQMIAKWPGKIDPKNKDEGKKQKNWMDLVSKGTSDNVYYSKFD